MREQKIIAFLRAMMHTFDGNTVGINDGDPEGDSWMFVEDVCEEAIDMLTDYINKTERIDAQPVQHARWTLFPDGSGRCTHCGTIHDGVHDCVHTDNFCRNCGAMMDERLHGA